MRSSWLYKIVGLFFLMVSLVGFSQVPKIINPKEASYGIDDKNKIVVWNYDIINPEIANRSVPLEIVFGKDIKLSVVSDSLSYQKKYKVSHKGNPYSLFITSLPVIHIKSKDTIRDEPKIASQFSFADNDSLLTGLTGIELRGNISLGFPKKSYDLEFWKDEVTKKSEDIKFAPLRTDDDWILDGLYNEPLRLRSYFCNRLWLDIHMPHYADKEKKAKSGIDQIYTEVFLNNEYIGIHALTEQVDRKLLKLKEYEPDMVRGELFKAGSYEGAPEFKKAPEFKNIFPHWGGYEMEYPVIDYKSHWDDIYAVTKFVIDSDTKDFSAKIGSKLDIDTFIDYFIFINLIRATDNLGKNYYMARYDKDTPYFMIPWDLDGVLGTIQDGKRIPTTDDILSNGLFDRLLSDNPNNYKSKLKKRWAYLCSNQLKSEKLFKNLHDSYSAFEQNRVYEREQMVWPTEISYAEHLEYLENWLTDRLEFLDTYFTKL